MKTKKPRSGKAAKPALRTVRRAARSKPKIARRKASLAKTKRARRKSTKKAPLLVRRKTRTVAKTKGLRKRVIRKTRTSPSPVLVESEQLGAPAVTGLERESGVSFSEPSETLGRPDAEQPAPEIAQADFSLKVPPILLEGDEPPSPPMSGPGQKYVLGPAPPAGQLGHEEAALPEAYGTGKLVLAARDPHWLYAQWDLTPQQQQQSNALSADRHLVVRVYPGKFVERPIREVHVHPDSRHWFIHVDRAETQYIAELGYYLPERQWVGISTSPPTVTPAEKVSTDQTVRFATIPAHVRLSQLAALVTATVPADLPPMEAARELALAELVGRQLMQQDWSSSAEVGELVRGRGEQEISAGQMVQPAPAGGEAGSVSSPSGAPEQSLAGFWFNVNAEVVIYGATEPDASVTIGSRPIELRPDGTFSCSFSLPDGEHVVTLSALSAQGDLRQAELRFSRRTECRGEVGAAPPDQSLETPEAESA